MDEPHEFDEAWEEVATLTHAAVMYHVTATGRPVVGSSAFYDEYAPAVYLFDDLDDAQEWLGYRPDAQLIAVSVEGLPLKWDAGEPHWANGTYWRFEGDPNDLRPLPLLADLSASPEQATVAPAAERPLELGE